MTREQALAIVRLPCEQAIATILALAEKAEHWERLHAQTENTALSPTTPSGMQPVYLKPRPKRRAQKPGRKSGHPGARRALPERIDASVEHRLSHCPHCETGAR